VVRKLTLILVSLLALSCSAAMAQRGFSGGHVGGRVSGRFGSQHGGRYSGYPLGLPYWDSIFSDDYTEYPPAVPPVVVIQPPAAADAGTGASAPQRAGAQPLLIELRGGRYVRIIGEEQSSGESADAKPAMYEVRPGVASRAATEPPSTLLVFRNGNREEITDYTIADGVLYAQANYYTDGSWNKRIPLSSLDLAATVDENRGRGVLFQIPASPNQVIVGP